MKMITTITLLALSLCSLNVVGQQSPYESVQESTDILLKRIVEVQPIYESDPEKFFFEVDNALDPYIDFDGFAKGVMAKHWRKADEAQKSAFIASFREGLIKTYATTLLEFDNQRVDVLEPATASDGNKATIELAIFAASGAIYPVHYQLELQDGRWMLRNVMINGINLGLQFRTQFNGYMQKYRGDIDKVIENWSVDVGS